MSTDNWMGLVQTLSVLLAITVAISSLRLRGDQRASVLAKMQSDIEHIKKTVDSIGSIREELTEARACIKAETRRMDEHLKYKAQS